MHGVTVALLASLGLALLAAVTRGAGGEGEQDAGHATSERPGVFVPATSSTSALPVAGVVVAADEVVVRAERAGRIEALPATEGARVSRGQLVARQATPVADARLARAAAEGALTVGERQAALTRSRQDLARAEVADEAARDLALLRANAEDARVREAARALAATLESTALTLSSALDTVDANRSAFPAEALDQHRDVVRTLYEGTPDYLAGGVRFAGDDPAALLSEVRALAAEPAQHLPRLSVLAAQLDTQLTAVLELYAAAEARVFDEDRAGPGDPFYEPYRATRADLAQELASLRGARAGLAQAADRNESELRAAAEQVEIAEVDREAAARARSFARLLEERSRELRAAATGVAEAERALASIAAPFSGVVGEVYVTRGDYVAP
ncbi:hypothetical protein GVX82_04080, partial [Patescibacteria group bacterium]|nr:hypothetical protein [Patescibacteria group bacterium]